MKKLIVLLSLAPTLCFGGGGLVNGTLSGGGGGSSGGGGTWIQDSTTLTINQGYTNTSGSNLLVTVNLSYPISNGGGVSLSLVSANVGSPVNTISYSSFISSVANTGSQVAQLVGTILPGQYYCVTNVTASSNVSLTGSIRTYSSTNSVGGGGGSANISGTTQNNVTLSNVTFTGQISGVVTNRANVLFISPNGNDSYNGLSTSSPLATFPAASIIASNIVATTGQGGLFYFMTGVNTNELANPQLTRTPNGWNIYGEPGMRYENTNSLGLLYGAIIRPGANSTWRGFVEYTHDGVDTTASPFGLYKKNGDYSFDQNVVFGPQTNIDVGDCTFISESQGPHWEGNASNLVSQIKFHDCKVIANTLCLEVKTSVAGQFLFKNNDFTLTNFALPNANNSVFRVFDCGSLLASSNVVTIVGGTVTYSDSTQTNFPACVFYNDWGGATADNILIIPIGITNAGTYDIYGGSLANPATTAAGAILAGVRRVDGQPLTQKLATSYVGQNINCAPTTQYPYGATYTLTIFTNTIDTHGYYQTNVNGIVTGIGFF